MLKQSIKFNRQFTPSIKTFHPTTGSASNHTLLTNENRQNFLKRNILKYFFNWSAHQIILFSQMKTGRLFQNKKSWNFLQLRRRNRQYVPKRNLLWRLVNIFPVQYPIQEVSYFGCSSCSKVPFVLYMATKGVRAYPWIMTKYLCVSL